MPDATTRRMDLEHPTTRRRRGRTAAAALAIVALALTSLATAGPASADPLFTDVPEDHPFATDIGWMVDRGITDGFPDGSFKPTWPVTRQSLAAFMYRFAGEPLGEEPTCESDAFTDVPAVHPFCGEIQWLVDEGHAAGRGDGSFGPADPVSRQVAAAFFYSYANPDAEGAPTCETAPFTDVPTSNIFCGQIEWLTDAGIASGFGDDTFGPTVTVSRQTSAKFLHGLSDHLAAMGGVDITLAGPPMFPTFDEDTHDYAVWCDQGANNIDVQVLAGTATAITVDGTPTTSGAVVPRTVVNDEAIVVDVQRGALEDQYWFRCLPHDFPSYGIEKPGVAGPGYYFVSFGWGRGGITGKPAYLAMLDTNGVPVWYKRPRLIATDQKVLPDGTLTWVEQGDAPRPKAYTVHTFAGDPVNVFRTPGYELDNHDIIYLANGNVMVGAYKDRQCVDLTVLGLGACETAIDALLQEIDPSDGSVVWEWDSKDHIPVSDTIFQTRDIVHWNSFEEMADGNILMSARSGGVYKINRATGAIMWKLGGNGAAGGSPALTIIDDPWPGPQYQHDARELPDGTITMHDNHGIPGFRPRAVRYQIDEGAMTATMVEQHVNDDPDGGLSGFIGGARWQPDGHVIMAWGGTSPFLEEVDENGDTVFVIRENELWQYRAVKYGLDELDIDMLRSTTGGDFRYDAPTGVQATAGTGQITATWSMPTAGAPISGYTAHAVPSGVYVPGFFFEGPGSRTCSTAGSTTCTITNLNGGTEYIVTVVAHNRNPHDSIAALYSNAVTPAPQISGTVTNADGGAPLGVVTVEAWKTGVLQGTTLTDSAGKYRLNQLPAGAYSLRFVRSGFSPVWYQNAGPLDATIVNVGATPVVADQAMSILKTTVSGTVTDEVSTLPVENATVRLWTVNTENYWETTTDVNGQYSFLDVPAGAYQVECMATGYDTEWWDGKATRFESNAFFTGGSPITRSAALAPSVLVT